MKDEELRALVNQLVTAVHDQTAAINNLADSMKEVSERIKNPLLMTFTPDGSLLVKIHQ